MTVAAAGSSNAVEVALEPGESVLFYSDGLVEAHDASGEMFGKDRVVERVTNHPAGPDLLDYLIESLIGFAGAEWRPGTTTSPWFPCTASPRPHRGSSPAERGRCHRRSGAFRAFREERSRLPRPYSPNWRDWTCPSGRGNVSGPESRRLAMNSMEHGNGFDPALDVTVALTVAAGRIDIHLTDEGRGMPLDPEAPDLEAKLAGEQSPRGWGIFLIRNMVDELHTTDVDGRQRLELVFYTGQDA